MNNLRHATRRQHDLYFKGLDHRVADRRAQLDKTKADAKRLRLYFITLCMLTIGSYIITLTTYVAK